MSSTPLLTKLKRQLEHEKEESRVYALKVLRTHQTIPKLLYEKILQDSMYHAEVVEACIEQLQSHQSGGVWVIKESARELLKLMNLEEEATRLFASAASEVDDPHVRDLMLMLAYDEQRHYSILRYILENFVQKSEEELVH